MTRLFVYGTLKRHGSNHRFLAGQHFIGTARTQAGFRLYDLGGYPGLVATAPGDGGRSIEGEVWEVDDDALARLDAFEGLDEGLYERVPVPLQAPHEAGRVEAYLYLRSIAGRRDLGERW